MENKFKDFWLLGHQCDPDKLVFIMDESDAGGLHVVEYTALELANAEINALKAELNEYDPNLPEEKSRLSPQRFIDELKLALESANAEILSQLKFFNEKLNAKDAEIAGWKLKNEALNWPAVEDKINIYKSENKKLTEQLESANAENERLKQELTKLKETNNGR